MKNHPERLRNFSRQMQASLRAQRPEHTEDLELHLKTNRALKALQVLEDEAEKRLHKRESLRLER